MELKLQLFLHPDEDQVHHDYVNDDAHLKHKLICINFCINQYDFIFILTNFYFLHDIDNYTN